MPTWIAWVALGCSVAVNGYLLIHKHPAVPMGRSPPLAQSARCEPVPAAPLGPAPIPKDNTCEQELKHCLQSGWNLVIKEIARQPPSATSDTRQSADGSPVTPARQREALCVLAKTHLHEHWQHNKDKITQFIATDLADPRAQAKETRETVEQMSRALGLTPDETDALAADYGRLRADRIARIRDALAHSPADYQTFLFEARGLFADEDALLERVEGVDAKKRWRAEQLTDRTSRLAILATFAGSSWDAATDW